MRVLRVSHSATVAAWRGRERALRARGAEVTLLTARRWHAGGVPVELQTAPGDEAVPVRTWGRHPALFVYDPRPFWRALGQKWDVIDIHEEPFALATAEVLLLCALRRNGAPVVLYTAQNIEKRYPLPFRWFERTALRTARGISACNTDAARISMTKGFPGRARVIPLGIDSDEFTPGDRKVDATAPVAGFLGRLVPEKGLETLLQAVAGAPGLRLRIAGAGPMADALPARVAGLGIADRVEVLGPVAPEKVPEFYRTIDVLAVPSQATASWTEQFGRVAVEAMAAGVPVVASDAGALVEVVERAGLIVPQGDAAALGAALVEATGPRRGALVRAGLARAATCTWDAVADRYLELYDSVRHEGDRADEDAATDRAGSSAGTDVVVNDAGTSSEPEIVVVAYGAPDLVRRALTPVAGRTVTVVDNSSLPEIAAVCAELGVRYLDPGTNGGFAAAVNTVLADRLAPGRDILLLNPDATIDPDQIALLQRALHADPGLASVGPAQVDEHGRPARVRWPFPTPGGAWAEALGLARLRRGPGFVIGSVLLLRGAALDQVGGFDERFFLYAEETDWAYRAHLLGWRHAVVPDAHALHTGAGTSTDTLRRDIHFHASQERYYRKHFGTIGWALTRAAVVTGSAVRGTLFGGERGRAAWRRAALYTRGPVRVEARRFPRPETPHHEVLAAAPAEER